MNDEKNRQVAVSSSKAVSFPSQEEWGQIAQIANAAFRSGLLPSTIKNAEAATIIALKAWELGLPPMMAYSHIHVINGKPTLSAELMQSLARKHLPGLLLNVIETTEKICVIEIQRPERGSLKLRYEFTIESADKAKLLGKDVWKQYPKAMLLSRCMSAALRAVCPDALIGVSYTPEELGASTDEARNVIETTSRPVQEKPQESQTIASQTISQETSSQESAQIDSSKASAQEIEKLFNLVKASGIHLDQVRYYMKTEFSIEQSKDLTSDQCQILKEWIQTVMETENNPGTGLSKN